MSQEALYRLLKRVDLPGEPIFTWEEVSRWHEGELDAMLSLGVLQEIAASRSVECDGCEHACIEEVAYAPTRDGEKARGYVVCTHREDMGRIQIDLKRLRQWRVDFTRFVYLISEQLSSGFLVRELFDDRLWHIGKLTNGRHKSDIYIFRGAGNDDAKDILDAVKKRLSKSKPFFLFPYDDTDNFPLSIDNHSLTLREILSINEGSLSVNSSEIFGIIESGHSRRLRRAKAVQPFKVAPGTKWSQIAISFVNEETVRISCGREILGHRDFIEMGFQDDRKTKLETPDKLWGHFKELARRGGIKSGRDPEDQLDPETLKGLSEKRIRMIDQSRRKDFAKWKDHVSGISSRMRVLFPDIPGEPIKYFRREGTYKTTFTLEYPSG